MTPDAPTPRRPTYAARAERFHPSGVRSVFDIAMQPGMISLAGGSPDLAALPRDVVAGLAVGVLRDREVDALQYQPAQGLAGTIEAIREVMRAEGVEAGPERIQVTAGSQMGLQAITTLLADPGDTVLAEAPTYVGALSIFGGLEAEVAQVDIDEDGMIPAALEETIARVRASGSRIPFLYTVPTFGNPSGATLGEERRDAVVEICRREGILIVEDNPYGMLAFDDAGDTRSARTTLYARDPENVVYLGSFSKIFSPGVRVGWVAAPVELRARVQLVVEAMTIHASVPGQLLAERFVTQTDWRAHVRRSTAVYRDRRDALMAALERHMPAGTTWTHPRGGFFTVVTLPDGTPSDGLLDAAIAARVVYVPGSAFMADGSREDTVRLAFSFEPEERLAEGARRLAEAVRSLSP
ncbi:PLP-dependent aminotransferase family protein [Microbacterium sp. NPDC096154]|uniref:aminotransferase-like domain-containing protein n=1 Tax=Microbacterium sp. NPDC096154 TaxID=3155549 RepID=UPI00332B88AD